MLQETQHPEFHHCLSSFVYTDSTSLTRCCNRRWAGNCQGFVSKYCVNGWHKKQNDDQKTRQKARGMSCIPPPSFNMSTTILSSCMPVSLGVVGEVPSCLTSPSMISKRVMLQKQKQFSETLSL